MKQELKKVEVKELYVAPVCECIEMLSEGILCGSGNGSNSSTGVFGAEGDRFVGEW
ncbi:hypothetical protein [Bacteroides sp. ET336]|uniref:hypothetical protein n=1 Tax=Bacteroides sp. ET336 TaxID=2972459 RepID=UPI0021ACC28C|nr:hypothetical protein [Bacteroides sp. ET336]MCR8894254.1 hypothetical protein [Bacteroides sp. ET336]MDN0058750.1 hypothetical protein [Bacteroides caecigallinarum]